MEHEVEGEVKVRGRMRFGVVGGGFAYRADILAWPRRPLITTISPKATSKLRNKSIT